MANRYGLYSALFDGGATTLPLTQLRSLGTRSNKAMVTVHPSGNLDPGVHIMSMARPVISFVSGDLGKIFGHTTPVSITAGLACPDPATFVYRQRLAGGAFVSSEDNIVQTVEKGFLHCTEISADSESQDAAQATMEYIALSSAGASPFTFLSAQAIPGAMTAPAYNSLFFHGSAYLNGVALPGLVRTRVRPGIGFKSRAPDGAVHPVYSSSSINQRMPAIELDFLALDMLEAVIGALTTAAFSTTLAVYFRKGSTNNEGRVADATAQHLKISAAAGSWGPEEVSVNDNEDGTTTVTVMPTGTLSLSAASAIP